MHKTAKQAVLYARFSPRPNAEECDSIERQLERLRAWCVAKDLPIAGEYWDADKSGKSTDGRDGLEAALRHVVAIRGALAVYDLARLSRKALDALTIAERLRKKKVDLLLLTEQIDTTTPMGKLVFTIQAGVAEFFRQTAAARTSLAMRQHQASGRRMGRPDRVPFGFRPASADPSRLEEDPEEQAAIRRIQALAAEGLSYRAICRQLDREGIQRRGKSWAEAHRLVAAILKRTGG